MSLVLVTGMPLEPHACVVCARGPRDNDGNIRENVFAEAVDINWGDSVYVCPECAGLMANLFGYLAPDDVKELEARVKELEETEVDYKKLKKRVKTMLDGGRARKEVRASDSGS